MRQFLTETEIMDYKEAGLDTARYFVDEQEGLIKDLENLFGAEGLTYFLCSDIVQKKYENGFCIMTTTVNDYNMKDLVARAKDGAIPKDSDNSSDQE